MKLGVLQVMFGLLVHQTRKDPPDRHGRCRAPFSHLDHGCASQQPPAAVPIDAASEGIIPARDAVPVPFGSDPMFNPRSGLYNPRLQDREASFYNRSKAAFEVRDTGMPYAFFSRPVPGLPAGFPVVFEARSRPRFPSFRLPWPLLVVLIIGFRLNVQVLQPRKRLLRLLRVLYEGAFLNDRTRQVIVRVATFDTTTRTAAAVTVSIRNAATGGFRMHTRVNAVQAAQYTRGAAGAGRMVLDTVIVGASAMAALLVCRSALSLWRAHAAADSHGPRSFCCGGLLAAGCCVGNAVTVCIAAAQAAASCALVATVVHSRNLSGEARTFPAVYHDLAADARVTMPAKTGGFSALETDVSDVAQLPGAADVPPCPSGDAFVVWSMPLWARADDNTGLDNMAVYAVRPCSTAACILACGPGAPESPKSYLDTANKLSTSTCISPGCARGQPLTLHGTCPTSHAALRIWRLTRAVNKCAGQADARARQPGRVRHAAGRHHRPDASAVAYAHALPPPRCAFHPRRAGPRRPPAGLRRNRRRRLPATGGAAAAAGRGFGGRGGRLAFRRAAPTLAGGRGWCVPKLTSAVPLTVGRPHFG